MFFLLRPSWQVGKTWRSIHQRSSKSVEYWEAIARSARNWRMVQQKVAEWIRWEVRGFCRHWKLMLESTMMKDFNKNAQQLRRLKRWVLVGKVQTAQKYSNPHVQNILNFWRSRWFLFQVLCLLPKYAAFFHEGCVIPRERLTAPINLSGSYDSYDMCLHVSTIFYIFCTHSISFPKLIEISRWVHLHPPSSCPRLAELTSWAQAWCTMRYSTLQESKILCVSLCVSVWLFMIDGFWWSFADTGMPRKWWYKWYIGLDQSALCRCAGVNESVFL